MLGTRPHKREKSTGLEKTLFWATFLLLATYSLTPLWTTPFPPMVDLPQHVAQAFIWAHPKEFSQYYTFQWFTPYSLFTVFCGTLIKVLGGTLGFKFALTLILLSVPLSLTHLLKSTHSSRWLALLGFPLAFGNPFYWGFSSYLLSIPLAALLVSLTLRLLHRQTLLNLFSLCLAGLALFFSHIIGFFLAITICVFLLIAKLLVHPKKPRKPLAWILVAILPSLTLCLTWLLHLYGGPPAEVVWLSAPPQIKAPQFFNSLLSGHTHEPFVTYEGILGGLLLATSLLFFRFRRPLPIHLVPVITAFTTYTLSPQILCDIGVFYERIPTFVALFFLCIFPAPPKLSIPKILTLLLICTASLIPSQIEFREFSKKTTSLSELIQTLPEKGHLTGSLTWGELDDLVNPFWIWNPQTNKHEQNSNHTTRNLKFRRLLDNHLEGWIQTSSQNLTVDLEFTKPKIKGLSSRTNHLPIVQKAPLPAPNLYFGSASNPPPIKNIKSTQTKFNNGKLLLLESPKLQPKWAEPAEGVFHTLHQPPQQAFVGDTLSLGLYAHNTNETNALDNTHLLSSTKPHSSPEDFLKNAKIQTIPFTKNPENEILHHFAVSYPTTLSWMIKLSYNGTEKYMPPEAETQKTLLDQPPPPFKTEILPIPKPFCHTCQTGSWGVFLAWENKNLKTLVTKSEVDCNQLPETGKVYSPGDMIGNQIVVRFETDPTVTNLADYNVNTYKSHYYSIYHEKNGHYSPHTRHKTPEMPRTLFKIP